MKRISVLVIFLGLFLIHCNPTGSENKNGKEQNLDLPGWKLIWNDEFEGESLNPALWLHETGGHGWGNNEEQYYTDRADNAYLEEGKLVIAAKLEDYEGKQ